MPTLQTIAIHPDKVQHQDTIIASTGIITGVRSLPLTVAKIQNPSPKSRRFIDQDGARVQVERGLGNEVTVQRLVATEEEKAARELERLERAVKTNIEKVPGNLAAAKAKIVELAQDDGYNAEAISSAAQDLAREEVMGAQWQLVAHIMESRPELTTEQALIAVAKQALRTIMNGPDDTWSGRGNDMRRVKADALRRWVDDLRWVTPAVEEIFSSR